MRENIILGVIISLDRSTFVSQQAFVTLTRRKRTWAPDIAYVSDVTKIVLLCISMPRIIVRYFSR